MLDENFYCDWFLVSISDIEVIGMAPIEWSLHIVYQQSTCLNHNCACTQLRVYAWILQSTVVSNLWMAVKKIKYLILIPKFEFCKMHYEFRVKNECLCPQEIQAALNAHQGHFKTNKAAQSVLNVQKIVMQ